MIRVPKIPNPSALIRTGLPGFDQAFAEAREHARKLGTQMGESYAHMMLETLPDPAVAAATLETSLDALELGHMAPGVPTVFLDLLKAELKRACIDEVMRQMQPEGGSTNDQSR